MQLAAGLFLHSTAAPGDPVFAGATIYLTEYNKGGAVGFVVNKPFGRYLHELEEFRHSRPFPLYNGGPVDPEHLFFLHRRPELIAEGAPVAAGVYSGGNFRQALNGINNGSLSDADIKLFVGYCGWDAGELEAEIAEGSWEVRSGEIELVFRPAAV
jgi:putative transcriptional regulator